MTTSANGSRPNPIRTPNFGRADPGTPSPGCGSDRPAVQIPSGAVPQ